jgi:hypothetical protein
MDVQSFCHISQLIENVPSGQGILSAGNRHKKRHVSDEMKLLHGSLHGSLEIVLKTIKAEFAVMTRQRNEGTSLTPGALGALGKLPQHAFH